MKKAIILARVSTKEQEATGLSIAKIQLPQMREYAKVNGFEIVQEFQFHETASQKLRKQFDEMIVHMKEHQEIKAIIAFRVDRMTRNYRDAVEVDTLRSEYDKELHFVSERLILRKESFGREIQEWDMKVFLAKQHINRCQEDTHNTLMSKLKSGEQYGRAPFGYRNATDDDGKSTVHVDPFEAGIVKMIFNLYVGGADSYLSIARKLNSEFPSLKVNKRKVEHIIKNHYYSGHREYKGESFPHKYQTLIEEETFELAQKKREGRVREGKRGKLAGKTGLFRGLLYCHECGCSYSTFTNRHKRLGRKVQSETYYYCTNAKGLHDKKPKGTNDHELTIQFAELFKSIQLADEDLQWLTEALKDSHNGKKEFTELEIEECNIQIKRYQAMIERTYDDKVAGRITQEFHDKKTNEYRSKQGDYQKKLDRILKADQEYYITATKVLELASRSYELFMGSEPEQKRQLITLTLQNLTIKDGKLHYEWIKPFDSIFVSAKSHKWGG